LKTILKSRRPALLCVLLLLFCVLVTHPVAETGMADDGSYVKTARVLAETGHIVYNGWATAMLGWQLFLGALFIKFLDSSFTAIRASTLLVALATAFLTQRSLIRAGVNSRNATIGTLALVLSPLFLPLAFSFMTDIDGLFCIVLCLYSCLRALQAESDRAAHAWLAFAALSNAAGGTVRQIAWLGVLVMVPCTVWLLRRRPYIVFAGVLYYVVSVAFIVSSVRWFLHQPYSIPEPLLPVHLDSRLLYMIVVRLCSGFFGYSMFLLPILFAFVPAISLRDRRIGNFLIFGGVFCLTAGLLLCVFDPDTFTALLAPYAGDYVTAHGLVDGTPIKGTRPIVLTPGIRVPLTIAVLFTLNCFFAFLYTSRRRQQPTNTPERISWNNLLILLVPFALGYLALLLPRCSRGFLFDRYLLPLLLIAIVLLLRLFQDRVQVNLPFVCIAVTALFAVYAVAGTHDAFGMYRTRQAAVAELRAAGVPATSIDGGFEQNSMTQIEHSGFINEPRIRVPTTIFVAQSPLFPDGCQPQLAVLTPVIVPGYALSFDSSACGGLSSFASVRYFSWRGNRWVNLYIVKTLKATRSEN
jgi:hypothetical protein